MKQVISAMFERKVAPGEHVIRQGDDGDNFYVIESGVYDVIITKDGLGDAGHRVLQFDGKGSFGELALMYNMPRAASVLAVTDGTLWAMDRRSFRRIVLQSAFRKRKMYEDLLLRVPLLENLDAYERMTLSDALVSRTYEDADRIIREGDDQADGMYFVESGEARVTITDAGQEREACRIVAGGYFGEMALLEKSPRSASVYACGRVKTAFLERESFERLLGPCLEVMKRKSLAYKKSSGV